MNARHILGIDAGGTKTALLRRSSRGDEHETFQGIHLLREGPTDAAAELAALIATPDGEPPADGVCIGIAGAGREEDRIALEHVLSSRLPTIPIRVVHDAAIALQAAWGSESGTVLIVGTGSVLFARDEEGNVSRAGGWGWRLGDDGSGTSLGRSALRIAHAAYDGGPPSLLLEVLAEEGVESSDALRHAIYVEERSLASFAPYLLQAATDGDWQAEQALMRETNALGQQAGWLATRLGETAQPRLALLGGLVHADAYRQRLTEALGRHLPGWAITQSEREPVEGAAELAEELVAA